MKLFYCVCFLALMSFSSFANAQADSACWMGNDGGPVISPVDNVSLTTPELVYDSDTGIVYIDTLGLNGIVDTTSTTILGDDVGMISVILEAPAGGTFIPQNDLVGGVIWTTGNQAYINNTMQILGTPVTSWGPPRDPPPPQGSQKRPYLNQCTAPDAFDCCIRILSLRERSPFRYPGRSMEGQQKT